MASTAYRTQDPLDDPRLVFVLCPSYHGATLLSLLLNNHPDLLALGDTIPARTFDQLCSCHRHVSGCDFWLGAFAAARAERFASESRFLPTIPRLVTGARPNLIVNLLLATAGVLPPLRRRILQRQAIAQYLDAYDAFHRATLQRAGARIFVDGQKSWAIPLIFRAFTRSDVSVLHVTRDPRGFVDSMLRRNRSSLQAAARGWYREHRLIELAGRLAANRGYLRIRYEDLAQSPHATMKQIFDFLGLHAHEVVGAPMSAAKNHVIGNKMKKTFDGQIVLDTRWRDTFTEQQIATVVRVTRPLITRYGYTA